MDAVRLIVAALVAGAAPGAGEMATAAIDDANQGLRDLLMARFAGKPAAELALSEYDKAPRAGEAALRQQLVETGANRDEAIRAAAEGVLNAVLSGSRCGLSWSQ